MRLTLLKAASAYYRGGERADIQDGIEFVPSSALCFLPLGFLHFSLTAHQLFFTQFTILCALPQNFTTSDVLYNERVNTR